MISVYGDPTSPPVVLLHGFLGTALDWKLIVDELRKTWFCIVPDLPGHGRNTSNCSTDSLSTKLDEMMSEVKELINQPVHLIGYSLGGRVAIRLAHEYPDWVASLCLESAHPGLFSAMDKEKRIEADAHWIDRFQGEPTTEVLKDWYRQPVFNTLSESQRVLMIESHQNQTIGPLIAMFDATGLGRQSAYWGFLAEWGKPLLYITGAGDKKFMGIAEHLKRCCPQAHYVTIPDAAHNTHLAQPAQFIQTTNTFLRKTL